MKLPIYIKLTEGKFHKTWRMPMVHNLIFDIDIQGRLLGVEILDYVEIKIDKSKIYETKT